MKKYISVFLAALLMMTALFIPVDAAEKIDSISFSFSNDLVGLTDKDIDSFKVETSDNVIFDDDPILVADYTGAAYLGEIRPGRTYYIYYDFVAADGYELPDEVNEENISIKCDDGVSVIWYGKTIGPYIDGKPSEGLMFFTKLEAPGNFFQRLFGRIADIFLKIRAWSPY